MAAKNALPGWRGGAKYALIHSGDGAKVAFMAAATIAIVKAGNEAPKSFDRMLVRDDIHIGYKFINGNVGHQGKKVTLPHYMVMFV